MNLPDQLLPAAWLYAAHLAYVLVLLLAVRTAAWARLKESGMQSVFFGACVVLLLLWSLSAGIRPGLHFHFLGVTALTLMFGWQLAVINTSLVVLGLALNGAAGWQAFSVNVLLMGAIPALVTTAIYRASLRWLPAHFFVYIFVASFFGAAIAISATVLASLGLLITADVYPTAQLVSESLPMLALLALPEGVLNGMMVTVLVMYRPQWVASFDDGRYLKGR